MKDTERKKRNILEGIAKRIRQTRQELGLSLTTLAEKAGFTKSYMSQIENMKREPTVGTLVSIANALGVDVSSIIGNEQPDDKDKQLSIVKKHDRRQLNIPNLHSDTIFESINYKKKDRVMDAYIITSSFEFAEKPMPHRSQELLFILDGKQEFIYNDKTFVLEKGDCAYFDARIPHYGRSISKKKSKALIVFPIAGRDSD